MKLENKHQQFNKITESQCRQTHRIQRQKYRQSGTFAKPSDVDAVQGVAAQQVQTYHTDRQTSGQRTTQKCAADEGLQRSQFACGTQHINGIESFNYAKHHVV